MDDPEGEALAPVAEFTEVTTTNDEALAAGAGVLGLRSKAAQWVTWLRQRPVDQQKRSERSWAFWDWSLQPFSSVILAFVFVPLYLTSSAFLEPRIAALPGADPIRHRALDDLAAGFGGWMTFAGIALAVLAPVLGQLANNNGRRKIRLGVANLVLIVIMALLFFIRPAPHFFALGAALLAISSVIFAIANVHYNSLITSVSGPATIGRVSGLGWGLGYFGGVLALVAVAAMESTGWFGLDLSTGMPFRWVALGAATWAFVFGWPLYRYVPESPMAAEQVKVDWRQSYLTMFQQIRYLFYTSRSTFWFLITSAIYRDGLNAIFTFGAIIAAISFQFSPPEVIFFGVAAYLISGISTVLLGRLDDYWGARRVIIGSLVVLLGAGGGAILLHSLGSIVFWVFGLVLFAALGPAQAASRSYLARVAPPGRESEIFGLYTTCGRATAFLAPALWTILIATFGATLWGLLGILVVIAVGLGGFIALVKTPPRPRKGWRDA